MKEGYMQQYAPPLEVYRRPANTFTADFVGSPNINLIKAEVTKTEPVTLSLPGAIELVYEPLDTMELQVGQKVVLGLRPEHVTSTEEPSMIGATVLTSLPSGMETIVQLKMGESYIHSVVFGDLDFDLEKQVGLSFSSGKFNLFDEQTKRNLGQGLLKKA